MGSFSINYLQEKQPHKNLDLLSNFSFSETSKGTCSTASVHEKARRYRLSAEESLKTSWKITNAVILGVPFYLYLQNSYQCWKSFAEDLLGLDLKLSSSSTCWQNLKTTFEGPPSLVAFIRFAALTSLIGLTGYGCSRLLSKDRLQEECYRELESEYRAIAKFLVEESHRATGEKKDALKKKALMLRDKSEIICLGLETSIHLTPHQSQHLSWILSRAASEVLDNRSHFVSSEKKETIDL